MPQQSTGQAVPLAYGYQWVTGQRLQYNTQQNTGNVNWDWTRCGFWLLGEGEWDGLIEMWDSVLGILLYQNENDNPNELHFHSGGDAVIGSGLAPNSTGPDQGVDTFWRWLPPGLNPLHYHRWAYYAINRKQPSAAELNQTNLGTGAAQEDGDNWTDINPIGLWRSMRCRQFDATGSMIGYGFTRNPAWHYVDVMCRRKLFREYALPPGGPAQDLPAAVKARFDWGALFTAATYFGEILANGLPRFAGDYGFSQRTTLQAIVTQILTCSRSFHRVRAGQFSITPDRPRASVFTFTRKNADSLAVTDADVHAAANLYTAQFRDLLVPAAATISSLQLVNGQPVINTQASHPFQGSDYLVIGNTGTAYDGNWQVASVPEGDYVTQLTLNNKGSNYPTSLGPGGLIGLRYSRFRERTPQFEHKAHQRTQGAVGVGIGRYRNRRPVTTDFTNCTWDQVSRVTSWQVATALGPDVQPYVSPPKATLKTPLFARDGAGTSAVALQLEPGDHVTIDSTLSDRYAGEWEIMQEPLDLLGSDASQGMQRASQPGGCTFVLRPYADSNYPDVSPNFQPGVITVPGLPGNVVNATKVPLADGGSFSYFQGAGHDGDSFQIPDGYVDTNMLCWASPQGFVESDHHMHFIRLCDADATRKLHMVYDDSEENWNGDVNVAGLVWQATTAATTSTAGGVNFVELTVAGGEKVLFGKGVLASGTTVQLPSGYIWANAIAMAFPHDASDTGHPAHGFGCWVDSSTKTLHTHYADNSGNSWEGPGQLYLVAWRNNMGTWKSTGNGWFWCPLPNGQVLGFMGASILDPTCNGNPPTIYPDVPLFQVRSGGKIPVLANMPAGSLQTMTGPNGFQIVDHDAHGIRLCTIDAAGNSTCTFEDGEGNVWPGSASVFGMLCDYPTAALSGTAMGHA